MCTWRTVLDPPWKGNDLLLLGASFLAAFGVAHPCGDLHCPEFPEEGLEPCFPVRLPRSFSNTDSFGARGQAVCCAFPLQTGRPCKQARARDGFFLQWKAEALASHPVAQNWLVVSDGRYRSLNPNP